MTSRDSEHAQQNRLEWPMPIPSNWQVDRLKWSTAGLINGTWGNEPNGEDDLICVRVADFDRTRFTVIDAPPTVRAIGEKERSKRLLCQGDLLIEKSGGGDNQPVGCVVDFDHTFDAVCSNFIGRITVAPRMWPRYWTYVHATLYAGRLNVPAIKQTTGIQNLDTDAYFNQRVPFPPFPQQHTIADYLDRETARLDALVAAKESVRRLLAEKRQAIITRAVTGGLDPHAPLRGSGIPWAGEIPAHWETPPVYARYEVQLGKMLDEKKIKGVQLAPYLRNVDVQWGAINNSDLPEMDFDEEDQRRYALRAGDILVCEGGEIGRSALWEASRSECYYQKALHRLRPIRATDEPAFFVWVMRAIVDSGHFALQSSAATIQHLPAEKLRIVRYPAPPVDEQRAIIDFLSLQTGKIDSVTRATDRTIALLKERRAALIAAAVTGQIDVEHAS